MILFFAVFGQLFVTIPLKAFALSQSEVDVNVVFLVNGVVGIVTMVLTRRLFENRDISTLLRVGVAVVGVAMPGSECPITFCFIAVGVA